MALWLEIRCDTRGEGLHCYSDRNTGPMGNSRNTRHDVLTAVRTLEAEAVRDGWTRTRDGMVCPACQKHPVESVSDRQARLGVALEGVIYKTSCKCGEPWPCAAMQTMPDSEERSMNHYIDYPPLMGKPK